MMGRLNQKYYLSEYINGYKKMLIADIDKLELTEHSDFKTIADRLKDKFYIEPIVLEEPIPSEPVESNQQRKNQWGEQYHQKNHEINVRINYTGNKDLFDCCPSQSTVVYLDQSVSINNGVVNAKITLEELNSDKYQGVVNKIIHDLSINLPRVHAEIAPWNNALESTITQFLEQRKGVVAKKFDFMEKIGLKVNAKSTEFMVPPPVAKKIIPAPITETTKEVKKEKIVSLQNEVYRDIIEVLYNVGKAIEKKPSIYHKKHEPDLRDVFLLFLETRYESTTGVGEAFNKKGKTDILLKYAPDGTNIFVAELKMWKGKNEIIGDINQLLGYLTIRDSKTALIYFVNQKGFIEIVNTLKVEIIKHPNYIKHIKDNYDSSISYEFNLPDDTGKTIELEVMLFHFPNIK